MLGTRSRKQSLGASLSIISLYLFLTNEDKGPVMLVDGEKDEPTLGQEEKYIEETGELPNAELPCPLPMGSGRMTL